MLYINNPEALVAIETERRSGLGLHLTADPDPMPTGIVVPEGARPRRGRLRFHRRTASTGYAAS